jgi:hypothetical protein
VYNAGLDEIDVTYYQSGPVDTSFDQSTDGGVTWILYDSIPWGTTPENLSGDTGMFRAYGVDGGSMRVTDYSNVVTV